MQLAKSILYSFSNSLATSSLALQSSEVGIKSNASGVMCSLSFLGAPAVSRYFLTMDRQ
jgi:hypothetical protein